MDQAELSHAKINFSYLDMYEDQVAAAKQEQQEIESKETIEEANNEKKKPAFFQRDKKVAAGKQLEQLEEGPIEPWRLEEYEAYKKMQKKLEVNFKDKELESHEKVLEFFKIPKDK